MSRGSACLLVVLSVTVAAAPGWAQLCGPADDPCVVTSDVSVPGDTTIDLGTRDLVVGAFRTIMVQGTGTGGVTIRAGDLTLATGAKIISGSVQGVGGQITLEARGALVTESGSRIQTTAGLAGDVTLLAERVELGGVVQAMATTRDGDGGYVTIISSAGGVTLGGAGMDITGGDRDGFGGFLDVLAEGSVTVTAPVVVKGGEGGDVFFNVFEGDLLIQPGADITANATTPLGDGGSLSMTAAGLLSVQAPVSLRGAGDLLEGAGSGGDVDLTADRVVLAAPVDLSGPGPDGDGGFLDVVATDTVELNGRITIMGAAEGLGGDLLVTAGTAFTVAGTIDLRGGYGGGIFQPETPGTLTLLPTSVVDVSATAGVPLLGAGNVALGACGATLAGIIRALGGGIAPRATVETNTGGALMVSGTVQASAAVTFTYRSAPPAIAPGAVVTPAPALVHDPELPPCCELCSTTTSTLTTSTTSTSDTTTTSVSTSTTTVSSTSSSTVSTSSSSSSTLVPATTTTTAPLSCLDQPLNGYAAVDCAVTLLRDTVAAQDELALGGRRSAKRLAGKIEKTRVLVERSRTSRKAARLLVKAGKKVVSFEVQVAKLLARDKISDGLAEELLALSGEVAARIDGVLTPLAN
ncbi:MAG TPA: hypothetical protein VNO26_08495 [Candidatus Limnocylindria bacterium]|nr:hypothetical protein [Candidatus Limnocylindria bacterium]